MSKLAHSNDETMAQIERNAENMPDEDSIITKDPRDEALYLANRDKESILRRLDTDLQGLRQQSFANSTINGQMKVGAIGALERFREAIVEGGWTSPRHPDPTAF